MISDPNMARAIERQQRLYSFYQMQRRSGSCPIEATEAMGQYAERLDRIEADKRASDDAFNRDLEVIRKCMERV